MTSAITPEAVIQCRVVTIVDRLPGSTLAVDAGAGAGALTLDDLYDFSEDGGTATIGDGVNSEPVTYTAIDDDTGILTLSGVTTNAFGAGDTFVQASAGIEKSAYLIRDDVDDEQVVARVPHRWYDVLPEGIRDPGEGEAVTARFDGVDWLIEDILGQTPSVDGSAIDPGSLPPPTLTDGNPPASSPTPVVSGGIGTIFVTWTAIGNADPVTYEVHVSTTTGFTPGPTTKAATTGGTLIALHALPDATPLDYATTYYVKLVAVDADGSAAAGAQGSGSPVQVNTPDIAVGAIIADRIAANAVTAEKLEAVIALVSTLIAGTPDAARTEVGVNQDDVSDIGIRAYDSLGVPTLRVDGQDGSVYLRGRLDFGQGSRLLANDIVELHKQEVTGVDVPSRVQRGNAAASGLGSDIGSIDVMWSAGTTEGSTLIAVVAQNNSGGGGNPATPTMSGWTQVQTQLRGGGPIMRQTIFKVEAAAARSGSEHVNLGGGSSNTRYAAVQIFEYSGTGVADVVVAATTGTDASVEFGSTGTLAQAGELALAFVSIQENCTIDTAFTDGFAFVGAAYANITTGSPPHLEHRAGCAVAEQMVTSTSSLTSSATTDQPQAWVASIVTFKAKTAGTDPPGDADILRIYPADDSGGPVLHVQDSDGDANTLAMAPAGVGWRMHIVSATINVPSTNAHSAGSIGTQAISGLLVGDLCVWIGSDVSGAGAQFNYFTDPICTVDGQIIFRWFNADTATIDPGSGVVHYFLVVNFT